jgi:TfoX/Sxy family transcriptional regulator of competence genes
MAFDEQLAERVRAVLGDDPGWTEKHMFGGICILVNGNMALGIVKDDLMVRVGPEAYEDMLDEPHARIMDFSHKPLKGYVFVDAEGTASEDGLRLWVERGLAFARTLPPK